MSSTWLYGLRNTYHESGIDVYEAFSCLRLYVRDLLSAGPSEYVIFMYDSLPPLFFPRHPFFFFRMVRAKRSSTCTPAHARAFTLKFAHLYETSVHTRVYVYTSCKFNGSVHRHTGKVFFLSNASRFPLLQNGKRINFGICVIAKSECLVDSHFPFSLA